METQKITQFGTIPFYSILKYRHLYTFHTFDYELQARNVLGKYDENILDVTMSDVKEEFQDVHNTLKEKLIKDYALGVLFVLLGFILPYRMYTHIGKDRFKVFLEKLGYYFQKAEGFVLRSIELSFYRLIFFAKLGFYSVYYQKTPNELKNDLQILEVLSEKSAVLASPLTDKTAPAFSDCKSLKRRVKSSAATGESNEMVALQLPPFLRRVVPPSSQVCPLALSPLMISI